MAHWRLQRGCGLHNPFTSKAEPVTYESVAQSELSPEEKVDKLVANMSDADKVGQLLMIGIHGKTLNDDAKFMLNEYRVSGIILFDRNMESKDQVKSLIADINKTGKRRRFNAIVHRYRSRGWCCGAHGGSAHQGSSCRRVRQGNLLNKRYPWQNSLVLN